MGNDLSRSVDPDEITSERPGVVDEAHDVLSVYGRQLIGTGAGTIALYYAGGTMGLGLPVILLPIILVALALLYMAPVTREPKLAREVIWRWDRLRVDRALQSSSVGDPRLEVAESMAERVLRHPSADDRARTNARNLVRRLRVLLRDLDRVGWLSESRATFGGDGGNRSISDLQDLLDARVAEVIQRIAELHSTVIMRDISALERVTVEAEELLFDLEAEREVERLLAEAERE